VTGEWLALVVARWLNFTAVAGLMGMALFSVYAPSEGRRAFLAQPATARLFVAGGALALISTLAWAAGALVTMTGDPSSLWEAGDWSAFLFETSFGSAWVARIMLGVLMTTIVVATRGRSAFAVIVALAAGLLFSQAWVGHVASIAVPIRWAITIAYALHVWGAAVWFGGLISLLLVMTDSRRLAPLERKSLEPVLERFSSVGLAAVLAILFGGAINVAAHGIPWPSMLLDSGWGRMLLVKLALVAAMIALACVNRFLLMPRLSRGEASAFPALLRSVVFEQVLAVTVLAVTATLGILDPSN